MVLKCTFQQLRKVKETHRHIKRTLYSHSNLAAYLRLSPQSGFFQVQALFPPAVLSVINSETMTTEEWQAQKSKSIQD